MHISTFLNTIYPHLLEKVIPSLTQIFLTIGIFYRYYTYSLGFLYGEKIRSPERVRCIERGKKERERDRERERERAIE